MSTRLRLALIVSAPVLSLVFTGCIGGVVSGSDDGEPAFAFRYESIGGTGNIDQTLSIVNESDATAAPTLEITALDATGDPLPGVRVTTAFGSDRGQLAVSPRLVAFDVLRFDGPSARSVDDVKVEVVNAVAIDEEYADVDWPAVRRYDARGREVDIGSVARISVTNDQDLATVIRIVGLVYEAPPPGESQQFVRATPLAGPVRIEPGDTFTADVPAAATRQYFGSIKAFASIE